MYNKFQYQLCEFMNQLSAADTSLFENFKNMHPQYSTINEKIKEFNIKKQQI